MKSGIGDIVGKTISDVVVASNEKRPKQQVFLVFSDGTFFEIYGESFSCAADLDRGGLEDALEYAVKAMRGKIDKVYPLNKSPHTQGSTNDAKFPTSSEAMNSSQPPILFTRPSHLNFAQWVWHRFQAAKFQEYIQKIDVPSESRAIVEMKSSPGCTCVFDDLGNGWVDFRIWIDPPWSVAEMLECPPNIKGEKVALGDAVLSVIQETSRQWLDESGEIAMAFRPMLEAMRAHHIVSPEGHSHGSIDV